MPSTLFVLPGLPTGGDILAIYDEDGLIENGLVASYLFEETSGTVCADQKGGAPGSITNDFSSNNAYSRLSGGGVQLNGAQIFASPTFDASVAWSMVTFARLISYIPASGTEAVCGIIGLRAFGASSNVRGAGSTFRGGNTGAHISDGQAYVNQRSADGAGARNAGVNGSFVAMVGQPFMVVMSYDGTSILKTYVYSADGVLVQEVTQTVSDAQLFTISTTTVTMHSMVLGGINSSFAGGRVQYEAAFRYNRFWGDFGPAEVAQNLKTGHDIGAARGRPWA